MRQREAVTLALCSWLAACGTSGGKTPAGAGGRGDSGSADGTGAIGDAGSALPACAIATRPQDPTDSDGAANTQGTGCNSLAAAGAWIVPEVFTWDAQADAGGAQAPIGGIILDGDYDLVRFQVPSALGQTTRRSIRVFGGGQYIEWAVAIQNPSIDGGIQEIWYDTTAAPSGHELGATPVCNQVLSLAAYTAHGDDLSIFIYLQSMNDPPIGIDTYRRNCTR